MKETLRPEEIAALEELERIWLGQFGESAPALHLRAVREKTRDADPRTGVRPDDEQPPPRFLMTEYTVEEQYGLPKPRSQWQRFMDDGIAVVVTSVVVSVATAAVMLAVMMHK